MTGVQTCALPISKILSSSFSEIDKAAKKGIIKGNTADRYKSRLAAAVKRNAPAK